jgi:hypothetical protein
MHHGLGDLLQNLDFRHGMMSLAYLTFRMEESEPQCSRKFQSGLDANLMLFAI